MNEMSPSNTVSPAKDRIKADLDYQVNVKTELELSTMAERIRDIEQKLQHIHHDVLEASGGLLQNPDGAGTR